MFYAVLFMRYTMAILKLAFLRDEPLDHKIRKVTAPEPLCSPGLRDNLSFALLYNSHVGLIVQFLSVVLYQKSNVAPTFSKWLAPTMVVEYGQEAEYLTLFTNKLRSRTLKSYSSHL